MYTRRPAWDRGLSGVIDGRRDDSPDRSTFRKQYYYLLNHYFHGRLQESDARRRKVETPGGYTRTREMMVLWSR